MKTEGSVEKESKDASCWDSFEDFKTFEEKKLPALAKETAKYPLWDAYFKHCKLKPKNQLQTIYKDKFKDKAYGKYLIPSLLHIKRGCKNGLDMAKNVENLTIYFVLDGIDLEAVVTKDDLKRNGHSFTAVELRYVYRNWEKLKEKV